MDLFNNIEDETKSVLDDPEKRAKIEQIAQEKGISLDSAKEHFLKNEQQ